MAKWEKAPRYVRVPELQRRTADATRARLAAKDATARSGQTAEALQAEALETIAGQNRLQRPRASNGEPHQAE